MWPADNKLVIEGLRCLVKSKGASFNVIWVLRLDADEAGRVRIQLGELGYRVVDIDGASEGLDGLSAQPLAVIVMKKGIFAELYQLGQAAFVGGGFGSGVHSVWEPALCGAQVACGPRTDRSPESRELAKCGRLTPNRQSRTDVELANSHGGMANWTERASKFAVAARAACRCLETHH